MRWRNAGHGEFDRRNREALVGEDLGVCWMVDGHYRERGELVVVSLPKFAGDAQIVEAVVRDQLVAPNLVLTLQWLRCCWRVPRLLMRNPMAEPHGTASFTNSILLPLKANRKGQEPLRRCSVTTSWSAFIANSARNAVVPLGHRMRATSVRRVVGPGVRKCWSCGPLIELLLDEEAGADLDFAADAEGVDALISGGLVGARANDLQFIVPRLMA